MLEKAGEKLKNVLRKNAKSFHFPHAAPLPYTLMVSTAKASTNNKRFYD
jgi:hypothetical protein